MQKEGEPFRAKNIVQWGLRTGFVHTSYLFKVLHVMFGGHKDNCLLLGLHHVPQQVQEHGGLVI